MSEQEKSDLKLADAGLPTGMYCQHCGVCRSQCRMGYDIPTAMRSYMYAYGYCQPALAQSLIASLDLPRHVCEDCSSCPIECLNEWNIKGKIHDIIRLRDVSSGFLV